MSPNWRLTTATGRRIVCCTSTWIVVMSPPSNVHYVAARPPDAQGHARLAGIFRLAHHAAPKGPPMPDVVLCADLGTQSLRVGAVTARGSVAAAAVTPL